MKNNMNLSIVIVSYNTREILKRCLGSLPKKFEIFVVDNASSDDSVTMIRKNFPKVKLIINKENLGFAKAVNQALRVIQNGAVLLLNSDTLVKGKTLNKLIEFEKQVQPAIIGLKMLNTDGTVQGSCFYLPTVKRAILEYLLGKKNYFSKYAPQGKNPVEVEAVSGGAMMISREVIDKIGLFDERFFMYFEDLDYCRRAKKTGLKVYFLPTAEIIHEHGASGIKLAGSKDQWKRLIPSSKIYHGWLKHSFISFILWSGQKCLKG